MKRREDDRWRGGAVLLGVTACTAGLHLIGSGPLAAPPVTSISSLRGWADARDPVTIGIVLVRLVALAVGYHLLAASALAVVGGLLRRPRLVRLADAATLPFVRTTTRRLIGVAVSVGALTATSSNLAAAGASPGAGPSTATLRPASTTQAPGADEPDGGGEATLRLVEPGAGGSPSSGRDGGLDPPDRSGGPSASTPAAAPAGSGSGDPEGDQHVETRTVRPGDHLWSIAEDVVGRRVGRPPTDDEVDRYWRRLVLANPQLADPDLLFPGDVVTVPPLPSPPSAPS